MINWCHFALKVNRRKSQLISFLGINPSLHTQYRNYAFFRNKKNGGKPTGSEVLSCQLLHYNLPPWTSYFVKYEDIIDDQWGLSHFNWKVQDGHNYHILRTGCYPYIKYHCTKRPHEDLSLDDKFFRVIKCINLGIPCLAYGIAARFLIRYTEVVPTPKGPVNIYFLYEEDKGSMY